MPEQEKRIFIPEGITPEPFTDLKTERSPFLVTNQTYILLKLFSHGSIPPPGISVVKYYLEDHTLDYLNQTKEGIDILFDEGYALGVLSPEAREASSHAFAVMASVPDFLSSRSKKYIFSRMGMFRAPETVKEYLERVSEMEEQIGKIIAGVTQPEKTGKMDFSFIRTYVFFKVASQMPVKLNEDEIKALKTQKEFINDITQGIDFSALD